MTTGIDLIEIDRIKESIKNERFLKRVFSDLEISFFNERGHNPAVIAANFCVKEAFSKSIGTGIRGFSLNEVSVLRDALGAPYMEFTGRAKDIVSSMGLTFSVSITHTHIYASAIVIAYKKQ
ncbi:MAG: holo-ACP synthase [Clostridiales bacterium]|nr:holo-ACP synthase [Clostridiales bacterium]